MESSAQLVRRPGVRDDRQSVVLVACGVVAVVATAVPAAIAAERPLAVAAARAAMVAVPVTVGVWIWLTRPERRFGLLLLTAGCGWLLTTLAESTDPTAYTVGRAAGWCVEPLLIYLFLAFPSGRLRTQADRVLVAAMVATVGLLFLPRLLIASSFDVPSPYTSCVRDCPPNALFALAEEPALLDGVLRPAGVAAVFVLMLAVSARLTTRYLRATSLGRRALTPVLAVAVARVSLLGVAVVGRAVDPTADVVAVAAWLLALAVPVIALAFLAGLLRWRLYAGRALERLAGCARTLTDAPTLSRAFADALEDPSIEVIFPSGGSDRRWVDAHGAPVTVPAADSGRCLSEVRERGRTIAAIVHDRALCADQTLLRGGVALAAMALENQRLVAATDVALREVSDSRARIAASAERERRRIERDLHDGAQQRLVALRIELGLAQRLAREDPQACAARLAALELAVDETLEELRALAHGVYPALLVEGGLEAALRAQTARFAIPVELRADAVGRYPAAVECAVYFCVVEALQNVLKHATGARRVVVSLAGADAATLRFSVRDDGHAGRAASGDGVGLRNMRDRLAAVGGDVRFRSDPFAGSELSGSVHVGEDRAERPQQGDDPLAA
ncbi:MAG TPA: histidine kinase [Conexibacter sp.]|nr:histidine kinase [Conexibacter sp.]